MGIELIWMGSSVLLGLILGVIGYYHSKLAYSFFTLTLTGFVFLSSYAKALIGGSPSNATVTVPMGEDGSTNIGGLGNLLYRAIDNMGMLPPHIQLSILLFVGAFFSARIGTWLYTGVGRKPKKVESNADRKKRILKQYGYTDGMPY